MVKWKQEMVWGMGAGGGGGRGGGMGGNAPRVWQASSLNITIPYAEGKCPDSLV